MRCWGVGKHQKALGTHGLLRLERHDRDTPRQVLLYVCDLPEFCGSP